MTELRRAWLELRMYRVPPAGFRPIVVAPSMSRTGASVSLDWSGGGAVMIVDVPAR
jgi:hypothetical protein